MSLTREFMSALAMLKQLQAEGEPGLDHLDLPAVPTLDSTLGLLPALPRHGVLLGVGSDGMPVMLDLRNPAAGALLVIGDSGCGKTDFLRFAAAALIHTHAPDEVQYFVLTPRPEEWRSFERSDHCLGIADAAGSSAGYALGRLAESIHENPAGSGVLLLVDDFTGLDDDALEVLSWAVTEGPAIGLWPLLTVETDAALEWSAWVDVFHTRIFGRMESSGAARVLAPAPGGGLNNLLAGAQFSLRSRGHWLRFWVPLAGPIH